jgi:hypothetical protein
VNDFYKPEELDPCKKEIEEFVDVFANTLHKAGKIKGTAAT